VSKGLNKRQALKDAIVAANIGWTADSIVVKRQTDLWNDITSAIACRKTAHRCALHIGAPEGKRADDDELEIDLTMTLTIVASPVAVKGETPEEDLWEDLVKFVDNLTLGTNTPERYRLRYQSHQDVDLDNDGISYLGRQTVFTMILSL
jgi:hypothetical protein